ncbi:ATP-binding protein [Mesobacillus foraminis]|uniref:ATP-binding protein n=1 Tax=Mesobacillus foraminis TaxID=279826 RepID=UPI001BED0E3F|nr:ATP-binding protein [Mesobacillus foraminis]MBT2758033.1 ATP-binding protein [Mesobacillus foraminis]
MLIEKLLLQILIVLIPIFVYHTFFENKKYASFPYLCGILQSISVTLCIVFSYFHNGFYWDLRYVPLILAFLYGGRRAGILVLISLLIVRTSIGGEVTILGVIIGSLSSILPLFFTTKFQTFDRAKRMKTAFLIGIWPPIILFVVFWFYINIYSLSFYDAYQIYVNAAFFGLIHIPAIWTASTLNESLIEKEKMRLEILDTEKFKTMGELAASIAHEIRNPLTVVKGFLQMMNKEETDKKNKYYFTVVLSELERAEEIIHDYLNFSKPQFRKVERLLLSDLIYDVCQLLGTLALKAGVEIHVHIEKDSFVAADRNQLKQAIINIIKNAIEASDQGEKITISLAQKKGKSILIIKDNGLGMNEEQLKRIGTLFYTTKEKGTGLGTTVTRSIIEALGGSLIYRSRPESGTEVTVTLPCNDLDDLSVNTN